MRRRKASSNYRRNRPSRRISRSARSEKEAVQNPKNRILYYIAHISTIVACFIAIGSAMAFWSLEYPAIKEQRALFSEQIELLKFDRHRTAKELVLDDTQYDADRLEAFAFLIKDGTLKNIDFSSIKDASIFFKDCRKKLKLEFVNLSNQDLSFTCFSDMDLKQVDMCSSNLELARFQNTTIDKIAYCESNLLNADFNNTRIENSFVSGKKECWVWAENIGPKFCRKISRAIKPSWEQIPESHRILCAPDLKYILCVRRLQERNFTLLDTWYGNRELDKDFSILSSADELMKIAEHPKITEHETLRKLWLQKQ